VLLEYALLEHLIVCQHAQLPGEVVVTDTRLAQRRVARAYARAGFIGSWRHAHQRLEDLRHIGAGEPIVAVPPLALDLEQPGVMQLREVKADGLPGYTGDVGQFRRC